MLKKIVLLNLSLIFLLATSHAQFNSNSIDWNIPELEFNPEDMGSVYGPGYSLVDLNGDGFPDLVDSRDNNSSTGSVWQNGLQRYWKVYLNNGTSMSATAVNWNIPDLEFQPEDMGGVYGEGYTLVDLNGDGFPDLVDSRDNNSSTGSVWQNGLQRYWKVYLNNGTSMSATAVNWNIPDLEFQPEDMGGVNGPGYAFFDLNGDGFPDLVDSRDNNSSTGSVWQNGLQRYWKVYWNNGTSISATAVDWNVPDLEFQPEDMGGVYGEGHTLIDLNGDGFPDLVDTRDNNSSIGSVWQNGLQRYWKVYWNNGTSITATAINWNIPELEFNPEDMGSVNGPGYALFDLNGDGHPDLVDSRDNNSSTGSVWQNSSQRYWKVYWNSGTAISLTAINWNIPEIEFNPEDMSGVYEPGYTLVDLNGDGFPDLVDSRDNNSSTGSVWQNSSQRYWKVYWNLSTTRVEEYEFSNVKVTVYPNPTNCELSIDLGSSYNNVSVIISNALGQVVQSQNFSNSNVLQLNIPGEAGVYFIEVNSGDKKARLKVMKK
jgi:hypothetical protein